MRSRLDEVLRETGLLGKAVERHVALTAGADVAAQNKRRVAAVVGTRLVDVADVDLHRGVVLGRDQAVGVRAVHKHAAGKPQAVS